jgi:DNA-binding NtrC family response regulator
LICATNRDLGLMVKEGLFREDLLYRINTIHIEVPPLRERGNDILVLSEFFLKKYSYKYNKQGIRINQAAMEKLLRYSWPGNVRELQHAIEKAVILSDKDILSPDDFFTRNKPGSSPYNSAPTLEEMEKQLIQQALDRNNGNFSAAATQLGITRQTLYNKMKRK